jgi:hypothetical protein
MGVGVGHGVNHLGSWWLTGKCQSRNLFIGNLIVVNGTLATVNDDFDGLVAVGNADFVGSGLLPHFYYL